MRLTMKPFRSWAWWRLLVLAVGLAALGLIAAFDDATPEVGVQAAPEHDYRAIPVHPFSIDDVFRIPH